ncbi:MAG: flagellar M-ring protein FliF [Archangiaceae bacterium]|nr:flagellar M-ring protein FliF [Archangiaceae bacterium]
MNRRSLWLVLAVIAAGCRSQIQHGLDERDANEIISVLTARGFEAQKVSEKGKKPTWAIEVTDDRATDALRVLTELKLPRPQRTTTRDVAQQSGLIDTPSAEKLRQLEALEGDIEQTLETMDGVVSAGVELVVPLALRPGVTPAPSKASALVRVTPSSLERVVQQRAQLKELIAGSVEGLKADDVALVIDPVESHVVPVSVDSAELTRVKVMVVVLASVLTLVSVILVGLALHLRRITRRRRTPAAPSAPPTPASTPHRPAPTPVMAAPSKPVIAAAAQRKVA